MADALALCRYRLRLARRRGFDFLRCGLLRMGCFHCGSVRHVTRELLGQLAFVAGVKLRIVAATRHGHVYQAAIDEFFPGLLCVDLNKHAVGGLALAAVARYSAL